ncbi:MAG: tetratricopeptide repeat protein [Flavobacteriaceae bacterium]|jgi:hypothetical protein|nr:tetratricopeptide repeat protein [Flavobacteriaceae bacterium]
MRKSIYVILFLLLSLSIRAQQTDIVKLYNQAQIATDMGYLDDAIEKYKHILEINPNFVKGYVELGNVYLKKGQDVNSLENAIRNFTQYLRINPDAEDAANVKATIDKLEFVLEKNYQKENAREFLQGRWASIDGVSDKYGRSAIVLDIEEFDSKIKIEIEPSSTAYSKDFTYKTVYIDDPNAEQYVVTFTNDNTYVPSQAGYALNSQLISSGSYHLGTGGEIANMVGQYFNSKKQEKDVSKKTLTVYELKINPIPDENNKLKCTGRVFIKEITPTKEQVILDQTFDTQFFKVSRNYVNTSFEMFLKNGANRKIAGMHKTGKNLQEAAAYVAGIGAGSFLLGLCTASSSSESAVVLVGIGAVGLVSGLIMYITGLSKEENAGKLYNEEVKKSRTSELKIGSTGNGFGLAFTF